MALHSEISCKKPCFVGSIVACTLRNDEHTAHDVCCVDKQLKSQQTAPRDVYSATLGDTEVSSISGVLSTVHRSIGA